MKKQSIFTIVSCLLFVFGSAQELSFGVKGGVNVSSVSGNAYVNLGGLTSKVSFHVGGVAEIPISDKFAVQPELLFSSQGNQWNFSGDNLRLDYVNLPLLGKYYIIKGLSAEAGAVAGYLISTNDIKENFNSIDVAVAIGASYKLNNNMFFSLRYNKGITNINSNDALDSSQNNVLQISAGYSF